MKFLYKYILLLFLVCFFSNDLAAKKKSKKTARSAQQIKKTASTKSKTKQSKKKKKSNNKRTRPTKPSSAPKSVKLEALSQTVIAPIVSSNPEQVPEKTITIISAFKPQLKNIAKKDFGNAAFSTDTSSISLNYQVPSQNLTFQYKPISLVPRAIRIVHPQLAKNSGLLKLGYGNYFQSIVDVNYSVIDNKNTTHSIMGNYEAFQGLHHLQKENKSAISYIADYTLDSINHLQTELFYDNHNRYRYGLVADSNSLPISNFLQKSTNIGARISWLNFNTTKKLILKPTLALDHFLGKSNETNTTLEFTNPMYFRVNEAVRINFDIAYSYSTYKSPVFSKKSNDILRFDPSVQTDIWGTNILLGVSPTFANGSYTMNPNILLKKKLKDTNYLVIVGWNTNYKLNKYKDLQLYNPWIEAPTDINNTIIEKKFIELVINASSKLDYSIGFAFNDYKQMPFFNLMELPVDKSTIGLLYETLFEERAKTLELVAKARYQVSDKLLLTGKLNYTQFNSIRINSKPWGITPLNIETRLNWEATEKLSIDANAQYWSGASFSNEMNGFRTLNNAFVVNAGLNYKLSSKWNAWVKGDNLLDKPYERWAYYPSLGVQLMVGIVYSFRQ